MWARSSHRVSLPLNTTYIAPALGGRLAWGGEMPVPDQIPPRILVAALVTLLTEALEHDETRHLTNDRLNADLRGLRTRVERELDERSGRRRLPVADESDDSASEN
jgi:hypothetical protein